MFGHPARAYRRAAMNIVWAALVVAAATGVAIAAMLLVRRRAPEGGYFADGDRAAGIFGVLATGFSVLLGFLIFLGFESYDASRTGAETEALTVAQQVQTAQALLPTSAPTSRASWSATPDRSSGSSGTAWRTTRSARTSTRGASSCSETLAGRRPRRSGGGGGLRQVARPDVRPRGGPAGPHPRRIGVMPSPLWIALGLHLGDRAGVRAGLRRQRRAGRGCRPCMPAASSPSSSPCCCCCTSSTTRSTAASADCSRRRWTGPSS